MTEYSRQVTLEQMNSIINSDIEITVGDLQDRVTEVNDEYGVDGNDFENAVENILDLLNTDDSETIVDLDILSDYLASNGY